MRVFGLGGRGKPRECIWSQVDLSWQVHGIGAVVLQCADFVAGAALWTWR